MLTKQKDTDYLLTSYLDDKSLLKLCIAQPHLEFCNDENFWQKRFYSKYGEQIKSERVTWKKFYLGVIYYKEKYPFGSQKTMIQLSGKTLPESEKRKILTLWNQFTAIADEKVWPHLNK